MSEGENASNGTFADAAEFGDMVINATAGGVSIQALETAGVRTSTARSSSTSPDPSGFLEGDAADAVRVERRQPGGADPASVPRHEGGQDAQHHDRAGHGGAVDRGGLAQRVRRWERPGGEGCRGRVPRGLGWQAEDILDLGDLTAARGLEMVLPLWVRLMSVQGTAAFNFKVVR